MLLIVAVKIETSSAIEKPTILEPTSNFNPQFFSSLIFSQQYNNDSKELYDLLLMDARLLRLDSNLLFLNFL